VSPGNYPLTDVAEFRKYGDPAAIEGVLIRCPNCGLRHAAWFKNPIGMKTSAFEHRVTWDRTGDTLETLSLNPSFKAVGCYHSWIRNGYLVVDSPFECKKEEWKVKR
jgi:hypothetical protein